MARVASSLRALLTHLIDYAGLFPPAALPLEIVRERYRGFRASPENWILNRLVLPLKVLGTDPEPDWRVTLLVDDEPGPLPPQVETLETRLPRGLSLPTYCEAPLAEISGGLAKIRTGGMTPDAIPSTARLGALLCEAAARRLPFKATAGLHHPMRSVRPLTYAIDSLRAPMHGFLNVFAAAALAWHGMEEGPVIELLEESDPAALQFADDSFSWKSHRLSTGQIEDARRSFAHSFGSCSFEEPVTELRELGLLP